MGAGGLAVALSHDEPVTPGKMVELGSLTLLELATEASLEQYVRRTLRIPIPTSNLGPIARIFDFVSTAAPAVREILTMGKIGHEVLHGPWDLVVVDAPASGHVVELLASPEALRELIAFGPLVDETAWMSELLADPYTTSALAVTLAEELAVSETLELLARIGEETAVEMGGIVVNRLAPPVSDAGVAEAEALNAQGGPLGIVASLAVERHRSAQEQRRRLDQLALPVFEVFDQPDDPVATVMAALAPGGES